MPSQIASADAQANLDQLCDHVVETGEVLVITRSNNKNVVLMSERELESLLETLHLLRSPVNATRLLTALQRARSRVILPQDLEEICQMYGLEEDEDTENEVAVAS
ncbi:MAG: type II toxin-antitoxin system Phd/YefM family antitoxin [Actinomycetota bacterium]